MSIADPIRTLYHRAVPKSRRHAIYRALHPEEFRALRSAVNPSPKGTFSLRRCDELRAIFVHTPKAAGTSIALSIFGELPYHYTASDYIAIFGRQTFREYFKFTFVRNPWDRVFSAYTYLKRGGWDENDAAWARKNLGHFETFTEFVEHGLRSRQVMEFMHFIPQRDFICDWRGRLLVDYLGYFETIASDFKAICTRIGCESSLHHTNRSTEADYRAAYTATSRQIVGDIYARDIALLGYDFEGIRTRRWL